MSRIQLSQPSFANGYARSRGESAAPDLWPSHAWVPAFGPQGVATSATGSPLVLDVAGPAGWATGVQKYNVSDIPSYDIGPRGYALKTNGGSNISGLINTGVSPFGGLSAMSFEIILSSATTGVDQIVAEDGTAYNTNAFYFLITSSNKFQFEVYTTSYATVDSALTISAGSVYHVVCTWEGVTGYPKIYINGLLNAVGATAKTGTLQAAPNTPLVLGNRPGALPELVPSFLPLRVGGMIYLARAYKRSLQPDEIARLYTDPYLPHRRRMPVFYSVPSAGGENYSLTLDGSSYGVSGTASQLIKATICGLATTSYEQSGTAAGLLRQLKVVGAGGSYEKFGTAAGLLALLKLIGGSGSYETSGTVNLLFRQLVLTAGLTSYAISGTDASLSAVGDSSLVVDPGGYEISGTTAALLRTLLLSAATSSYTKSGTAATLLRALSLGAVTASYTISGTAAELTGPPGAYILDASWSGAQYWLDTEGNPILDTEGQPIVIYDDLYKIVPKVAELLRTYPLSVGTESYSVSGIASDLLKLAKLISGHGAYDYSGRPISGGYQRLFAAAGATYEQTGTAIDLSKTNSLAALAGSYSLLGTEVRFIPTLFMVGSGSYNLLGTQISTILSYVLLGTGGEYVLTGTDNPLYYGFFIIPQSGSYLSAGVDADLRMFSGLSSYGGSYLVSGNVSDLKFLHKLGLGSSQYDITGTDPDMLAVRALTLGSDSYVITGEDVAFDAFYLSTLEGGSYLLNGVPITFGSDYILYARPGTINYSGQIALLWYSAEIIGNVLMFLDIKTAEIILAVKSPQLILEFNERN